MIDINTIYNEDCISTMERMDDKSIDLVVTSPPYDDMRTYGNISAWNFDKFKAIARPLTRVLAVGGGLYG